MSAKINNTKIGIFVLAAITLLIAGLLAFGAKSYLQKKSLFETAVTGDVYGLSVGSQVQLRGVPIGQVRRIDFVWNIYPRSQSGVIIVEFEVDSNILPAERGSSEKQVVEIATRRGLRALVKSQGITGTSMLALETLDPDNYPAPPIDYKPRHNYIPSAPAQFTRMLEAIEKSLESIQQMDFSGMGRGVTNALGGVAAFTEKLNELDLKAVSTNASALLVDLRGRSSDIQITLNEIRETLQSMKLGNVSSNADRLLTGLQDSNTRLQTVLDHVGELPLQEAVVDLRQALQDLNLVLVELQKYPSGFIFGKPPQPAKSLAAPQK